MKHFIVSDNKTIVEKVLKGLELADQKDNKLTLVKLKILNEFIRKPGRRRNKKTTGNCTRLASSDTQFQRKWKH